MEAEGRKRLDRRWRLPGLFHPPQATLQTEGLWAKGVSDPGMQPPKVLHGVIL